MPKNSFSLIAAPHTPMEGDGALALDRIPALAAHLARDGVTGVFVAGTTGEGQSLTTDERRLVAEKWCADGKERGLKVIVHVGGNCLADAESLARHAARWGADAISAMAPFFFKPGGVEELVDFCASIAQCAAPIPFYFYHIPDLTGVDLPMVRFLELSKRAIPSMAGIKYTSGDLIDFQNCLRFGDGSFDILYGTDESLLAGLSLGARGAVGSSYNFAAPLYRRLVAAFEAGDLDSARKIQAESVLLIETIAPYGYTAAAKSVMALVGIDCGPARRPLAALDAGGRARLKDDLERIGFFDWVRAWGE